MISLILMRVSVVLRSKPAARGAEQHSGNAAKHLQHQPDSRGTSQGRTDPAADPFVVEGDHQPLIGKTNDGVIVCASPV